MAVTIKLNMVRHSARKLQPLTRMMSGKNLTDAINSTAVMSQHSATFVNKALKMAAAAAKQKEFDADKMVIAQIFATNGPKIRRVRANARGHANAYKKHLAHLTVILSEAPAPKAKPAIKAKKTEAKIEKTAEENKENV